MITFLISITVLIAGYFTYGKFIDRFFGADPKRPVPAIEMADGVDYQVIKPWKIFIIQFLNIAGLGPIFGAIMGAAYGPIAYLWIVLGCIFMGAAHDYTAGMLSLRHKGASLNEVIGIYLGKGFQKFLTFVIILLLFAVGTSFISGPAGLLHQLSGWNTNIWLTIIFIYYIIATLLPIDKIIGTIYPYMGAVLLFMAAAIGVSLLTKGFSGELQMVELTAETFRNYKSNGSEYLLVPMLFIVISCGAISGFHATQSPLMARCMSNEKYGRPVFFGAMIAEGVVACIWATAAMAYFGGPEGLNLAADSGNTPAIIVNAICQSWLGKTGAIIAILGIVVCPITSGDTAFRSLRLILSDTINYSQKPVKNRILICIPIFAIAFLSCTVDFSVIWTYVGISNQLLAATTLWACAAYYASIGKSHLVMTIPAIFITYMSVCFLLIAPNVQGGLNLPPVTGYIGGGIVALACTALFYSKKHKKL
ncbi:MAG: carbon starvation protein A [Bacteroidales bacterium]|nr:carbon starvation protein A [Bacteroidales bacterium]